VIRFLAGAADCFSSTKRLGHTTCPEQWLSGVIDVGVQRVVHEADYSAPSSTKFKSS
jgi:hypothetical protein